MTSAPAISIVDSSGHSLNGTVVGIGTAYTIRISGAAANSPVTAMGTQNGVTLAAMTFGNTDSSGSFNYSGTFASGTAGTWYETWSVGGQQVGSISFTVSTGAPGSTPPVTGTQPPATGTQPTNGSTGGNDLSNLLGGAPLISGISNTTLALGAAGLLLVLMMGGRR